MQDKPEKLFRLLKEKGPMTRGELIEDSFFREEDGIDISYKEKNINSYKISTSSKVSLGSRKSTIYYIFGYHSRHEVVEAYLEKFPQLIENSDEKALRMTILDNTSKNEKDKVREVLDRKLE